MTKFETIGNATLILYEGTNNHIPLLATDPWLDEDNAYFGSWKLSHKFPQVQRDAIKSVKYIFISHFHPDHLNLSSLKNFKQATIIIAQHYASRVENDLRSAGFNVLSLPSKNWISIAKNIKVMLFNDEKQDSSIAIHVEDNIGNKSLILNLNDSGGIGDIKEISKLCGKYERCFYLALHGYGDADMINLFNESGQRIEPRAAKKIPVGRGIMNSMKRFNCNIAIPFSSFHQYVRRDSFWANKYTTPLADYKNGFNGSNKYRLLSPFQNIILKDGSFLSKEINPESILLKEPINESEFGDNWNEKLTAREIKQCQEYFYEKEELINNFKNISIDVGGIETFMIKNGRGIASLKFEVPRASLIKAIRREIFDDLLIGNFMKTTLINTKSLYNPDFALLTTKYADNGGAKTTEELKEYFAYYNNRRSKQDKNYISYIKLKNKLRLLIEDSSINELSKKLRKMF